MAKNHFSNIGALKPRRTVFDLSYRKNFTCHMGQLIPVMCDEVVPGDSFTIGNELIVRFQPLVVPIMHEITATVHYFFCPYRVLWDQFEDFISQGQLSGSTPLPVTLPLFDYMTLLPTTASGKLKTLWDYFGFPIRATATVAPRTPVGVLSFPWRAYNMVWNEYYRDENLQLEVDLYNNRVLNRNWKKDYFTSALPFRQKGQAPALPVNVALQYNASGSLPVPAGESSMSLYLGSIPPETATIRVQTGGAGASLNIPAGGSLDQQIKLFNEGPNAVNVNPGSFIYARPGVEANFIRGLVRNMSTGNPAILSANASTFNVSDLRLAFQVQKWLERNARGGTRYTEFLRSHFGVSPTDARLDRPEYIGGTKMPIQISEVLQTSESTATSPQANMGGHGLGASGQLAGKYHVQEFGLIIGLLSVMPKRAYQDGINRQWTRRLPTDFYFPEFAHLSEQAIGQYELFASFGSNAAGFNDDTVFGFCGQYDEMRVKYDQVCSEMRMVGNGDLSYWNLADKFNEPPLLNSEFITCSPRKDIFLVGGSPSDTVDTLIVNCRNLIRAVRPLPEIAEPGLIDHY